MSHGPTKSGFEPRTRDPERRDFFDLRRRVVSVEEYLAGGSGTCIIDCGTETGGGASIIDCGGP